MGDYHAITKRVDQVCFWLIFFNMVIASYLLVSNPSTLAALLQEDYVLETSGAIFLLLAGMVLAATALTMYLNGKKANSLVRWRFFLVGAMAIVSLIAFAEEISWGQRIFQFETPVEIAQLNRQSEFNFHNFNTRIFNNGIETLVLLIILVSTICIHRRKDHLFGFVIPSYWLVLSFQMVAAYVSYNYLKTQDYIVYLVLLYFLIANVYAKDLNKLFYALVAMSAIILVGIVNVRFREMHSKNGLREFREYLFSFIFFVYSLSIYLQIKYTNFQTHRQLAVM